MTLSRRQWLVTTGAGSLGALAGCVSSGNAPTPALALPDGAARALRDVKITALRVTPIALPDPPILYSGGAHGPYFLRTIVEIESNAGVTGIAETRCSETILRELEATRSWLIGANPFAYRKFQAPLAEAAAAVYPALEVACLDLIGRLTGRRVCELLGGPVRDRVEFSSYLFFRYAADHPRVLDDPQLVDGRGRDDQALDQWGEVRTPEAMADMAWKFREKWGFRFHKLKAGVLPPDVELETMQAINARFGGKEPLRIDPNAKWTVPTALRIAEKLRELPLDYYEDPVEGIPAMAEVRGKCGLKMSTNMCITRFAHLPEGIRMKPVDIVLADIHTFSGFTACQALGTIADTVGWNLSQHSNNHAGVTMAAMITLGAVTPQLTFASDTHYPWLVEGADIIVGPNLPIKGGMMEIPAGPGLGVELDRGKLAKAHEVYVKCGMRGREDGSKMRRFEPDWKPPRF